MTGSHLSPSTKVKELLSRKKHSLVTVGSEATVAGAIEKLVEHNIGALPVCDSKGRLMGIVSERDLLRVCARRSREIGSIRVREVMTKDVVVCGYDDDLNYVTHIMTQKGIRHLPILEGSKLAGFISMRDLVDAQLEESKVTVRLLSDYISGPSVG